MTKQIRWMRMATLVVLVSFGARTARAQQEDEQQGKEQGNYNVKQSIEFGGRFTSTSGDPQAYNTFVNLREGESSPTERTRCRATGRA